MVGGSERGEPRFAALGIVVEDMERALAFYRLLGLEFVDGAESEGHVETTLPGGIRLMFDTAAVMAGFDPSFDAAAGRGRVAPAFECESPAAVDAAHLAVTAAGYASHLAPFDAPWGQRYATVIDADGTHVDLFAPQ